MLLVVLDMGLSNQEINYASLRSLYNILVVNRILCDLDFIVMRLKCYSSEMFWLPGGFIDSDVYLGLYLYQIDQ